MPSRTLAALTLVWGWAFILSTGRGNAADLSPSSSERPIEASAVLAEAQSLLREGESGLQEGVLSIAQDKLLPCAEAMVSYECCYELSRVHLGLSVMHKSRGEKKQGRKNLEEALRWARKAAELKGDSAKVHALLADLWGERLVAYGGFLAGPKFGPKVKDENQKAVSLSPNDPVVLASLGRQYLLSPKAFGGDVPKAIDLFKRSLALDPSSDATYVWLARAYKKQKDRPNFLAALGMALRLRPENAQARWELEGWPEDAPPSDKSEQKEGE